MNTDQPLGIIEGFFGRSWSWQERKDYAKFLALNAFNFYIYAPKSDTHLRKQWQTQWPKNQQEELLQLRAAYKAENIRFGVGLSPHEIYVNNSPQQRQQLSKRIKQINQLKPDILCILFDDMRGDLPNLAQIQIDLAHQAAAESSASHIIFCPTYYSFDPVLTKVFGCMPDNYWQTFAKHLDSGIDMFWTGEKVCSKGYSRDHLQNITELLGRKPFLWDNYPVNDGAVKSQLLQLRAFDKSHSQLNDALAGHAINPMNQPWLSRIPLTSLTDAYRANHDYSPEQSFKNACRQLCEKPLAEHLIADIGLLQDKGLAKLSPAEIQALSATYHQFPSSPYAQEILAWLDGGYRFDPACLTE